MDLVYKVGDIAEMKKPHPCTPKSKQWEILELSGDVKLKCLGCGHILFLTRWDFEKRVVKIITK